MHWVFSVVLYKEGEVCIYVPCETKALGKVARYVMLREFRQVTFILQVTSVISDLHNALRNVTPNVVLNLPKWFLLPKPNQTVTFHNIKHVVQSSPRIFCQACM